MNKTPYLKQELLHHKIQNPKGVLHLEYNLLIEKKAFIAHQREVELLNRIAELEKELAKRQNMLDVDRLSDWLENIKKSGPAKCCYNCATPAQRMSQMIVCPNCGNKRCPKATDHNHRCTGSNEPGQAGSRY